MGKLKVHYQDEEKPFSILCKNLYKNLSSSHYTKDISQVTCKSCLKILENGRWWEVCVICGPKEFSVVDFEFGMFYCTNCGLVYKK